MLGDRQVTVGVSIGITMFPQNDQTIDTLLKHADAAMYQAKQQGGNAFQLYLPTPTQSGIATLS
jgi:diguanylate cyclase (GGDEF)-like protein